MILGVVLTLDCVDECMSLVRVRVDMYLVTDDMELVSPGEFSDPPPGAAVEVRPVILGESMLWSMFTPSNKALLIILISSTHSSQVL